MSENIRRVFHPGFYLREYIEELEITQDEFSKRLGITAKQVSLILSEEANITTDIAYKLSKLLGTSVELWTNLQSKYDTYLININSVKEIEEEKKILNMIDSKFLVEMGIIDKNDSPEENLSKVRTAALVASLESLKRKDIYCYYRTAIEKEDKIENIVCKNFWVSIATQLAVREKVANFDENKLKENIITFRNMTIQNPLKFYPDLKKLLASCGVVFVLLPSLKNSNINGVVKWLDGNRVMMALNTRGAYNDKFWFSFFHELKHVLQKAKRKIIIGEENVEQNYEIALEREADEFAKNILIPQDKLDSFKTYTEYSIRKFAREINIHPGIVVGRLQKEGKIKYSYLNNLKEKYEIV